MRILPFSSVRSVLFVLVVMASAGASFGQVAISITIAPPPLPVYEQPLSPGEDYLWIPGYWTGISTARTTTGCRAHGCCPRRSACCGPRPIGLGSTPVLFFTMDFGPLKWVSMAASFTASATSAEGTKEVIGSTGISITTWSSTRWMSPSFTTFTKPRQPRILR